MKLYQITFSPTGGTEKVAAAIASVWEERVEKINLLKDNPDIAKIEFASDDVCIVAMPAFGGRVVPVAAERLKLLKGNGANAVAVAVFGNRAIDDTLVELQDLLEDSGFNCIAGIEAVAEHSLVRAVAAGRPDSDDKTQLKEFGAKIKFRIDGGLQKKVQLPGNRPYKPWGGCAIKPVVGFSCNGCTICALECPTGAISRMNPRTMDEDACISCMRCISVCPRKARSLDEDVMAEVSERMRKMCAERKPNKLYI